MRNFLLIVAVLVLVGCSREGDPVKKDYSHLKTCLELESCDNCVIIDKELYKQVSTENYVIQSATITGNCLELEVAASGCSGDTWKFELVDMAAIAESNPPQRYLRLKLIDLEECEAFITKTISFNIKPLQVNEEQVLLNLEKREGLILYSY